MFSITHLKLEEKSVRRPDVLLQLLYVALIDAAQSVKELDQPVAGAIRERGRYSSMSVRRVCRI